MEQFYFEFPSLERKEEALEYINEFHEYNSKINGVGGLDRYNENYEEWLVKIEDELKEEQPEGIVPAVTYFLVRESDNKIIGMINIRLRLNEYLRARGGHIGYSIRPTERRNGYNKINLYLGLKVLQEYGAEEAMLTADLDNPASWKTMEALGGRRVEEFIDEADQKESVKYLIPINEALKNNKDIYEPMICKNKEKIL